VAARPDLVLGPLEQVGESAVGEALALELAELVARERLERALLDRELEVDDLLDLREEPRVDLRVAVQLLDRHPDAERVGDVPEPLGARVGELVADLVRVDRLEVEAVDADLEPAQRLLQRLLERAPDRHHLADRLHLRGQPVVGLLELLEREARHLGDDVVDRRLERRGRRAPGDVVREFVERVADRELRRDLRDREPGRLRRERGAARHARVHLDHDHATVGGADRELHVRPAGVDADLAQHGDRRVAHQLVLLVGQRLRRRDGDRVPGVHPHRIEVLDRAHDDAVVLAVAHHLHLELLPAEERLLDQELVRRAHREPPLADLVELVLVVGDPAAGSAERERGPDDAREPDLGLRALRLLERVCDAAARRPEADARHRRLELLAVLGLVDRLLRRADQLDVELRQHALAREVERAVERGLPAHRRQQRVGALALDDPREHRPGDRLDVRDVGHLRVGHDRGRIAVHEDDLVALLAQRLARLRARVVELARLADDDRAGADDQDGVDVGAFGHGTGSRESGVGSRPSGRSPLSVGPCMLGVDGFGRSAPCR